MSEDLGKFFKAEGFLKMTKTKKDQTKLEREIKYQFSPQYRVMMDNIRKPTLYEPPKTYASNQLYEPIKFYKLVKQEGKDNALENKVRE